MKKPAGQARSWKGRHFLDPRHGHDKHTASAMLACSQWGRRSKDSGYHPKARHMTEG